MTGHEHAHDGHHHHEHGHGHSHGLVDPSIKRSREGLRAVLLALLILGVTALAQMVVVWFTGSVALLADFIHNVGDAATAIPLGIAFMLRRPGPSAGPGCSWWRPSSSARWWPATTPSTV